MNAVMQDKNIDAIMLDKGMSLIKSETFCEWNGGFIELSISRKFPYGYLVSTSEQLDSITRNMDLLIYATS